MSARLISDEDVADIVRHSAQLARNHVQAELLALQLERDLLLRQVERLLAEVDEQREQLRAARAELADRDQMLAGLEVAVGQALDGGR